MKRKLKKIALTLIGLLILWLDVVRGAESLKINVSDISSGKVEIVGTLGLPLGRVCRIKGTYFDGTAMRMKAYDGVIMMRVTMVNGKELKKPVLLRFEQFQRGVITRIEPERAFDVYAYETGQYVGIPSEAFKHVPAVTTTDHFFETSLAVLKEVSDQSAAPGIERR